MKFLDILESTDNVKTVGDLQDLIASLPREMPVHQRAGGGSFRRGADVRVRKLATHEIETDYHGDMTDKIWRKTKRKGFGPQFDALVID